MRRLRMVSVVLVGVLAVAVIAGAVAANGTVGAAGYLGEPALR